MEHVWCIDHAVVAFHVHGVYANRTQAKKIITILILARFSGIGRHNLHNFGMFWAQLPNLTTTLLLSMVY